MDKDKEHSRRFHNTMAPGIVASICAARKVEGAENEDVIILLATVMAGVVDRFTEHPDMPELTAQEALLKVAYEEAITRLHEMHAHDTGAAGHA